MTYLRLIEYPEYHRIMASVSASLRRYGEKSVAKALGQGHKLGAGSFSGGGAASA